MSSQVGKSFGLAVGVLSFVAATFYAGFARAAEPPHMALYSHASIGLAVIPTSMPAIERNGWRPFGQGKLYFRHGLQWRATDKFEFGLSKLSGAGAVVTFRASF
jgi:hypothetical protein